MNMFVATGNLGSDCTVRTAGQSTVCTFSIAVKAGYGKNESTLWLRCNMWGKRADGKLPEFLVKGCQVAVSGEISLNEWEKDGVTKTSLELNVREIDLVGSRQNPGNNQVDSGYQGGAAPSGDVPFAPCF